MNYYRDLRREYSPSLPLWAFPTLLKHTLIKLSFGAIVLNLLNENLPVIVIYEVKTNAQYNDLSWSAEFGEYNVNTFYLENLSGTVTY